MENNLRFWDKNIIILSFGDLDMQLCSGLYTHLHVYISQLIQTHEHSLKQELKSRDFLSEVDEQPRNIACPQIHQNSI